MADIPIDHPTWHDRRKDYEIDYSDSKLLWKFAMNNCEVAEDYAESRARYAHALKTLKLALAKQYRDKKIDRKLAEDKAYLIMAEEREDLRDQLRALIHEENTYKGLEKVLEARAAAISFNQSLIKNQQRNA